MRAMDNEADSLRRSLAASGFETAARAPATVKGDRTSYDVQLLEQEATEGGAHQRVTAASLEAADAIIGLHGFLSARATPASTTLRDEVATMRTSLLALQQTVKPQLPLHRHDC